ncbi:MAPEG family protein [Phaeobacter gallaeciensis]|uniref:MAPEG family protein n=1 Tax=Phaeobacter gallaeciensis TaxID=60890 RepID=UPI00237F5972|nr:MAPEG family protein [Phaeobacter gallaeciensis]MDE4096961.1 MAPEG family protein [Phaeobacter gallaeciensis]MDE4105745.1 MAPEG family protein [Phaeobacter gallaeciensis]MDE4110228.1 MAPEG family protein [Phaeobacter gallaeciensis]MDE4114696.1 MAPEG family protein [Phaeobacter gallaeciensis]MDE4119138.1 MAPEG family protein [Phaeobacter gallaeciensis]
MTALTLENPVFVTYVIAAALLVLKVMAQGWMTVHRMMKVRAGWASPEDLQKGLLNTAPDPSQLDVNEYVDRSRRMHRNDLENIPAFWAAGLLFVAIGPSVWLAHVLMYGFVAARLAHFWAYTTKQSHEVRATFYTVGSLIVIYMACHVLWVAIT